MGVIVNNRRQRRRYGFRLRPMWLDSGVAVIGCGVVLGAVGYLNSRPLTDALGRLVPHAEILVDLPSRLADSLVAGRLDVALVPSIEYFRHPGCAVVSDACVACDGPVRSVRLFGRVMGDSIIAPESAAKK